MKRFLVIATLLATGAAGPAFADAIDGDWCFNDGRHFSIEGPRIQTPGGRKITGNYTRHTFDYVVPAQEPGAGQTVRMNLMGEYAVQVTPPAGSPQVWRRCEAKTS